MNKKNKFKISLTKLYLTSFAGFVVAFLFIFLTPMFTGGSYSYAEATVNEYQTLGGSIRIALVKKEYNPENELMRLDFSVKETTSTTSLPNVDYEVSSRYVKGKSGQEVEVIRVSDNYFVALIKNVPDNYGVLSTTIVPKYIHPELQKTNDLEGRSVKVYVNESSKIINNNLEIVTEKDYKKEYISFQQEEIKVEIEEKNEGIKTNKLAITEIHKLISQLESDLKYQTKEEQFETNNKINSHKTMINTHKRDIESLQIEIEELNEKINLLDEKKSSI